MRRRYFLALAMLSTCVATAAHGAVDGAALLHNEPYDASSTSVREGFSYLTFLESGEAYKHSLIGYDSKSAVVINKKLSELPFTHPMYVADEFEANDVLLLETPLGVDGKRYYVVFSAGPSADPAFHIIAPQSPEKYWATIYGSALAIPGNGALYAAGRYNQTFTYRNKYRYDASGIKLVQQPYAYVGLKSRTLAAVTLYSGLDEKSVVAKLPAGTDVEVLLADETKEKPDKVRLLLKTPFGLVGWAWVGYAQYRATEIDGISYQGD